MWDVLSLIKKYKENQANEEIKQLKEEWITKADKVFSELQNEDLPIDSDSVYERLGVRRNVLVRNFPVVTAYVADRLMKIRQMEQQEKLYGYIQLAKEAVAQKIQKGVSFNQDRPQG